MAADFKKEIYAAAVSNKRSIVGRLLKGLTIYRRVKGRNNRIKFT